ncbi:hypothetical protein ZIOFF_047438 [Zingiber officinale]|uniref:Uncharacterized protein n=1 Tax=Zingiber officinale TaxID=94328 RepID=A0A8J5G634_ZINOF|nr:hypothetical protein ZIOFF_047438 [Zingiber officinale]
MALVVICGQPCSGKSTAAACLADAIQSVDGPKPSVRIIDESSLHLGRNQSYAGIPSARFETYIEDALTIDLQVFCDTADDTCRQWNRIREEMGESSYETKIFEDLVQRFEKPERRNRWDSPLFELFPSKVLARATDANSLYEMDKATQEVINIIVEAQSQGLAGSMSRGKSEAASMI